MNSGSAPSESSLVRSWRLIGALCWAIFLSSASHSQILVVGDSIGAGYGVPERAGWVSLLDAELSEHKVINASISGDTSSGAKARLPALLEHFSPELVIIEVGGNDGLRGQPVALLKRNLNDMIDLAEAQGARVLLLGMRIPPNYGKAYTEAFHAVYHQVAKERQLEFLPFLLDGIALDPTLMQADRIHPNERAQAKILQNVLPLVQQSINNRSD